MNMLDEIINKVQTLDHDQQKEVLKKIRSLQGREKRKYQRLTVNTNIDALVDDSVIQSETRDISASGVYIKITGKFERDKNARVIFAVPGHNDLFKIHGKIARTDQRGIAIKFGDRNPYVNRILDEAIWSPPPYA